MSDQYGVPVSSRRIGTINPGMPRKFGDSARGSMDEGMTLLGRRNVGALLEDYNRIPPERGIELGPELMAGIVEMDETYLGGKPRKKNRRPDDPPGSQGVSSKTPIIGAVERGGLWPLQQVRCQTGIPCKDHAKKGLRNYFRLNKAILLESKCLTRFRYLKNCTGLQGLIYIYM